MAKQVQEAMTTNVRTTRPDESVLDAARVMRDEDVGSVPVVDGERLTGIVTDRDIVVRGVAEGRDPGSLPIADVATGDPVTVEASQDLDEALRLMAQHQIRRLPVVEGDRLVGILAQADVALESGDRQTGELLDEISRPS